MENCKTGTYRIRFIDSVRFMVSSLSSPTQRDKYKNCESYLEHVNVEDALIVFKCVDCKNNLKTEFNEI